jgi:hypothetical protein
MAKERGEKRDWLRPTDWLGRVIGGVAVTAVLVAPALQSSSESVTLPYNPGIIYEPESKPIIEQSSLPPIYDKLTRLTRDTGMDSQPCFDFDVCGTDLGRAFLLPPDQYGNRRVGQLFGDTFKVKGPFLKDEDIPATGDQYRAQVMLRSSMMPVEGQPIIFDGAAGLEGNEKGTAPEFLGQWHILMNDGVSLPDGRVVVSYQHTVEVEDPDDHTWHTDRSSLAVSYDGGNHFDLTGPDWENDAENDDPYQMWSMQLDGDYVYIVSVRAGRKPGPMMLFRVPWDQMMNTSLYKYWNGEEWGEKSEAKPLKNGHFGEPSLRKLSDGTWVLSYADYIGYPKIVTQTIDTTDDSTTGPEGPWTDPKIQLTAKQLPNLYDGSVHPYSTKDNLILMISTWQTKGDAEHIQDRELVRYDVSHLVTTV